MADKWKTSRIEDCMEAIIDYRGKTPKKTVSGVPLVTAKIIKSGTILPVTEYIAKQDYDSWMRRGIPRPGDIVMTTEAPLGEIAQLDTRKIALAQRVITLRGKNGELDNTFLKYLMLSTDVQNQLLARSTGTTVKGIKQTELREVRLTYPGYPVQRRIADILGTLDDKIDLNRRMNETLEAMAQRLFKSWFIDFDPVRAKAALREKYPKWTNERLSREALPNLDPKIAELFPDAFEKALIPAGWTYRKLGEVIEINSRSIRKGDMDGDIRYIDIASVSVGNCSGAESMHISEAPSRARRKVQHGDTIWSCVRPNRRSFYYIHSPDDNLLVSTGFAVLTPSQLTSNYIYYATTTQEFTDYLISNADGSAYPAVRADHFAAAEMLIPTPEVLEAFETILSSMRDEIATNDRESKSLAALRDRLLPKLLSGELIP